MIVWVTIQVDNVEAKVVGKVKVSYDHSDWKNGLVIYLMTRRWPSGGEKKQVAS
jgi:hypothetical protein